MLTATTLAATHRTLAPIDLVILGAYFVLVFGIGFYFSRKERTSEDYFLAGRNIGWPTWRLLSRLVPANCNGHTNYPAAP